MARTEGDNDIRSRTSRRRLEERREPYWSRLSKGCYLGYRSLRQGAGTWVVRFRDKLGQQHFDVIGNADDFLEADGLEVLTFDQAIGRARDWCEDRLRYQTGRPSGPYSVKQCMDDYLEYINVHRKSGKHLDTYIKAYIIPRLGKLDCAELTATIIRKWHTNIAAEPPRLRTKRGVGQKYAVEDANPDEAKRKRRLRANRHLVTLRAALNLAWREGRIASNDAWSRVRLFSGTERSRNRILTHEEARRLINTAEPDLRRLVRLALLTGARYGELTRFEVGDLHPDAGTLMVRDSKSNRSRHIYLNDEALAFARELALGRAANQRLLVKADGEAWGSDHHQRPFKAAVKRAGLDPKFTFHELRHTWASLSIMAGAELMVVAEMLGHSDTTMVQQHYGHLAKSFVRDVVRRTAPSFGTPQGGNVVSIASLQS